MNLETKLVIGFVAVAGVLTLAIYPVKPKPLPINYQYGIATIGNTSKCEYIAARKNTNDTWIVVAHKGDCSFCSTNKGINLLSK